MFTLGHISRFEGEKGTCKILKPVWDVITDYLVLFLAVLSVSMGGMQLTSGTFECLAVAHCPGMSRFNMSNSLFSSVKYRNACKVFYNSRKTNVIKGTDVVIDLKSSFQFINFVNSECSKSAVPKFLSYFGFVLFLQAFVLIILDNLWLKLPVTASVIESFVSLVMECYASPCPNFALMHALSDLPHRADNQQLVGNNIEMASIVFNNDDEDENEHPVSMSDDKSDNGKSHDVSILEDPASISAIKSLYEKVDALKKNIKSSCKIWRLYLLQAILQFGFTMVFLCIDIYYMKDLQETMTCRLTQHIPVVYDNFICSHNLAPAFVLGLQCFYLPALGITLAVFVYVVGWTAKKSKIKFNYVFDTKKMPSLKAPILSELPSVDQDLGFLLHLLHSYNKSYVVRFAHFLSEKSKKKVQAFSLRKDYPITKLRKQLTQNGNTLNFTDIQGIPETIFKLSTEIVALEFMECKLQNDDFKTFFQLTCLRKLSIIQCRLKSIPEGIFNIELLEELILKGNLLTKVNASIAQLEHLTLLDLSYNKLKIIEPQSCENLANLFKVYLLGNPNLEIEALKVVLACERLRILYSPPQLSDRINELNPSEREKFNAVGVAASGDFFVLYTPKDAPHIPLGNHEKIYKMNSCPKGIALIINNYYYRDRQRSTTTGREKDVAMLKSVLEKIGFETIFCINETANKAREFVKEYAHKEKYKDCDCIVVVAMCRGYENGLIFSNDETVNVMELVYLVQESPFYQEKPKLFFIQAGRERITRVITTSSSASNQNTAEYEVRFTDAAPSVHENGERTTIDASAAPVMTTELPPVPKGADILLSYSTMQGFGSFCDTQHGSWYLQALVETLREHAWEEDILSLLTIVNYKVVRRFSENGWRQVPAPQSTLRKKLYLLPGFPN